MAIVRWNPWNDLFSLHNQMDQLFKSTLPEDGTQNAAEHFTLPVDIRQSEDAFIIEASIPGFDPKNVEVTFEDSVLNIKGTWDEERERGREGYIRRERRTGSVYRQIALPSEVRADEISAAFHNGLLTITVPRAQKAQPKRITVTTGAPSSTTVVDGEATGSNS